MGSYLPPGWPRAVQPPDAEGWQKTAVAWLFEIVPPGYRQDAVLRRYPAALVALARHHNRACVEGARDGYRVVRTELSALIPPHAVEAVLKAYRAEGSRLHETGRGIDLVDRALKGQGFSPVD